MSCMCKCLYFGEYKQKKAERGVALSTIYRIGKISKMSRSFSSSETTSNGWRILVKDGQMHESLVGSWEWSKPFPLISPALSPHGMTWIVRHSWIGTILFPLEGRSLPCIVLSNDILHSHSHITSAQPPWNASMTIISSPMLSEKHQSGEIVHTGGSDMQRWHRCLRGMAHDAIYGHGNLPKSVFAMMDCSAKRLIILRIPTK